MWPKKIALIILLLTIIVSSVSAIPAAPTISLIGSNNFTVSSNGGTAPAWFRWGVNSVQPEWKTPNQTPVGGVYSSYVYGSPYFGSTIYYAQACDTTGCSASTSFTSLPTTPMPQTTYGAAYENITANGFNIIFIIQAIPQPYLMEFSPAIYGMGLALIAGLLVGFYFIGLWLRQRKVSGPVILGMMVLAFFLTPQAGFNWGLPYEMAALAQMMCYAALAGMIFSLFKKG